MRGPLRSSECESREEYHLTNPPQPLPPSLSPLPSHPIPGDRIRHPRRSHPGNWRLDAAQPCRACSAPPLPELSSARFSPGDPPHAARLPEQLGGKLWPPDYRRRVGSPCGRRSEHRALGCGQREGSLGVIPSKVLQKSLKVQGPPQPRCRSGGAMWLLRTPSWTPSSGNSTVKVRSLFCEIMYGPVQPFLSLSLSFLPSRSLRPALNN